jgi:hypothetical protein
MTKARSEWIQKNKYLIAAYLYIIIFTVILAILSFTFRKTEDFSLGADFFLAYVPRAQQIVNGQGFPLEEYRGPLYSFFLALPVLSVYPHIFVDYFHAGMLISILSTVISLILAFHIFRLLLPGRKAIFALAIYSIVPIFILSSYSAGSDMLFNVFCLAFIYIYLRWYKRISWKVLLGLGVLAALAFLTRYIGVILIGGFVIDQFFKHFKKNRRQLLFNSLAIGISFLLTISPYLYLNWIRKGVLLWNKSYLTTVYEVVYSDKISLFEFFYSNASNEYTSIIDLIVRQPISLITRVIQNIWEHNLTDFTVGFGPLIIILALGGGYVLIKNRQVDPRLRFIIILSFIYFTSLLITWHVPRYSLFMAVLYCLLATVGFAELAKFIVSKFQLAAVKVISGISIILVILITSLNYNSKIFTHGPNFIVPAGLAFEKYEPRMWDAKRYYRVATRLPHSVYYFNIDNTEYDQYFAYPPVKTYTELMEFLRQNEIDYLLISTHDIIQGEPSWDDYQLYIQILSGKIDTPELELIYINSIAAENSWPFGALYHVRRD